MGKTKLERTRENTCIRVSDEFRTRVMKFAETRGMNFSEAVRYLCSLALDTLLKK